MSTDEAVTGTRDALDRLLDALDAPGRVDHDLVHDGLAALIDRVGESTVHLLEMIERGAPMTVALSHAAVADVMDLCGLHRDGHAPSAKTSVVDEVAVSITPRPRARCEVCGGDRADDHGHVADVDDRRLLCVCDACRILLEGQDRGRLRTVPAAPARHVVAEDSTPTWWDELDLPVGLVFLLRASTTDALVAGYPGPAGVVESERPVTAVPPELWPAADTEALIVLASGTHFDAWLAPVTLAYAMTGRLRDDHVMGDPMSAVRDIVADMLT